MFYLKFKLNELFIQLTKYQKNNRKVIIIKFKEIYNLQLHYILLLIFLMPFKLILFQNRKALGVSQLYQIQYFKVLYSDELINFNVNNVLLIKLILAIIVLYLL